MRSKPARIAAAGLDLLKLQARRELEKTQGLPAMAASKVLASSREDLGLEPLPPALAKWVKAPPPKGGKAR